MVDLAESPCARAALACTALLLAACGGGASLEDAGRGMDSPEPLDVWMTSEHPSPPDVSMDVWMTSEHPTPPDIGLEGSDAAGDAPAPMPCDFVAELQRTCSIDADCAFGVHQTDCCGNQLAMGFHESESARFASLEPACSASYPACGCPARPTQTDSGETVTDPSSVQVGCISRGPTAFCMTYVSTRPPDGV